MEVTVPYAEAELVRAASSNSWVKARQEVGMPLRVYYSQVFWVDQLVTDDAGAIYYRINPNYYGGVDMLLVPAEAFRPINPDELSPLSPQVEEKKIEVDLERQTMSCFEDGVEVKYCRVSTGAKFNARGEAVDTWSTPVGQHRVTRKFVSLQMSGGTTGAGYDIPGIGWVVIFATGGVAFHSTFWHNLYGDPLSRGCVNLTPENAKWVFRWTMPEVVYDPGMLDVTVTGEDSTRVRVLAA
jgi:lipoprotein-anchoring transpeptidase ErfK/SrfK